VDCFSEKEETMKGFKTRLYFYTKEEADRFFDACSKKIDEYVEECGGRIADTQSIQHAHIRTIIDDNYVTIMCRNVSDKHKAKILRLISEII
jgi:hypothetical protein